MTNFVCINGIRIHKNTIKKYSPNGETKLNIYYAPSRNKVDVETFSFDSTEERDEILEMLDLKL